MRTQLKPLLNFLACSTVVALLPRRVRIDGQKFVVAATNSPIVLVGPNIIVKGPPYLPAVSGTSICNDDINKFCTTFNQADIEHIKAMGWNSIRLGVVWAGAQPRDEDALDVDFLRRLHAILSLTDQNGINVLLDNHGDMVGTAGCGNGVPMWFQQKAAGDLIGKPLTTDLPYRLIPGLDVSKLDGYAYCGRDASKWAAHAGDPNYNLLNECCQQINGPNGGGNIPALGFTSISQKTMDYLIEDGPGRADFVRFWTLVANEVKDHPSAIAAELFNEPMSIRRKHSFATWRACAEAINAIIPDMSVSLADVGEAVIFPEWVSTIGGADVQISSNTLEWIRSSQTLFYSWHFYDFPKDWQEAAKVANAISADWNVPNFATEFMSCDLWKGLAEFGISHSYWHYSNYCNTGPQFGNRSVPDDTFGACILGWGGGDSSKKCDNPIPWFKCADEWSTDNLCECDGLVRFGSGGKWTDPKKVSGKIKCDTDHFHDPKPFAAKQCQCQGRGKPKMDLSTDIEAKSRSGNVQLIV